MSSKDRRYLRLRRKAWSLVKHLDEAHDGARHDGAMTDAMAAALQVLQRYGRDAEARAAGIDRYCESVRYYW